MRNQTDESTLEFAHVRSDVGSNVKGNVSRQDNMFLLRLFLQDGNLGLQIGWLNVSNQAPLETAAQAILNLRQFFWRTITGDDDLLHRLVQSVKRVEELLLRALLLSKELDIVNQQNVNIAKLVAKTGH